MLKNMDKIIGFKQLVIKSEIIIFKVVSCYSLYFKYIPLKVQMACHFLYIA